MKQILYAAACLFPLVASALPEEIEETHPNIEQVGASQYKFFFKKVYDIAHYQDKSDASVEVLEITYHMNLKAGKRIDSAIQDFIAQDSKLKGAQLSEWQEQMEGFFPDVKKGDYITIERTPAGAARFYHNDVFRGVIDDAQYTGLMFGIWLGEDSPHTNMKHDLTKGAFHK